MHTETIYRVVWEALLFGLGTVLGLVVPWFAVPIGLAAMWFVATGCGVGALALAYWRPRYAAFAASFVVLALASVSLASLLVTMVPSGTD